MATSMAVLSRRLCRSLLSNPRPSHFCHQLSTPFCTTHLPSHKASDSEDSDASSSDSESAIPQSASSKDSNQQRSLYDQPLENGLDMGIYKVFASPIVVVLIFYCLAFWFLISGYCVCIGHFGWAGGAETCAEDIEEWEDLDHVDCWDGGDSK